MAILRAMNRRTAKRLFAIAGRLLLAVSLVFSTGPWASVLASVQAGDCQHMMSTAQHGSASTNYDCCPDARGDHGIPDRSEEHTSELQSLMRISYAVFCLQKKNHTHLEEQHSIKYSHSTK